MSNNRQKSLFVSAIISLIFCSGAASAQSADPKNPAPLQPGDNIAVISSEVPVQQYYFVTIGPGKGTMIFEYSSAGFPGVGGEIRITLMNPQRKDRAVIVKSTKAVYSDDAARPGQVVLPFEWPGKNAVRITFRIDPPTSPLLVAAGRYNIKVTGDAKFGAIDSNKAQAVGTYRVHSDIFGKDESKSLVKLLPDGTIVSETGAKGSWTLFDPTSKTYVLQLAGKRSSVKLWPAVGFSVKAENAGIPDLRLFQ